MKRIFMLLMLAGTALGSAVAQDTLHMRDMRLMENYYVHTWPDTFPYSEARKVYYAGYILDRGFDRNQAKQQAWRMYTEDTLQVYGIAVGLTSILRSNPRDSAAARAAGGTSHAMSYEWWRLYEAKTDKLRPLGEDLEVNLQSTPVAYYVDMDLYHTWGTEKLPLIPMYELYFSEPHAVVDSFYVGRRFGPTGRWYTRIQLPVIVTNIESPGDSIAVYLDYYDDYTAQEIHGWHYFFSPIGGDYRFIFPILTPQDSASIDTTGSAVDTAVWHAIEDGYMERDSNDWIHKLGVDPAVVARYVQVTPNPATGVVKVVSSFGLQGIEAYNESGVKVCSEKAAGLMHKMDVSSWAKGMYVLKIGTDMGTTMKRLVVH